MEHKKQAQSFQPSLSPGELVKAALGRNMNHISLVILLLAASALSGCAYSISIADRMELGSKPLKFEAKQELPTYASALEFCIELADNPSWEESVPNGVIRTKGGKLVTPNARVKYSNGEYKDYSFSGPATSPTTNLCWSFDERRSNGAESIELTSDYTLLVNRVYWYRYHGK